MTTVTAASPAILAILLALSTPAARTTSTGQAIDDSDAGECSADARARLDVEAITRNDCNAAGLAN